MLKSFKGFEAYWVWTCISALGWIAIGPGPVVDDHFKLAYFFLCGHNSLSFAGQETRDSLSKQAKSRANMHACCYLFLNVMWFSEFDRSGTFAATRHPIYDRSVDFN